jgi:hypothetical protein
MAEPRNDDDPPKRAAEECGRVMWDATVYDSKPATGRLRLVQEKGLPAGLRREHFGGPPHRTEALVRGDPEDLYQQAEELPVGPIAKQQRLRDELI